MIPFLRRRAMLRGPFGGSRGWTALWALLLGARLVRRFAKNEPQVVFKHEIKPGESLLISGDGSEPRVYGGR